LFLEHGRSDDLRTARLQDWLNPIQKIIAAGCNLNRRIDRLISEAGLEICQLNRLTMEKTPRLFAEVYSGMAGRKHLPPDRRPKSLSAGWSASMKANLL